MAKIVGLPKLSPTMEEGTLARWVVKEGSRVQIDDLIAEIETDKATMEWRAFDAGVLLKILAPEGTVLEPDAPVAIFGEEGEDIADLVAKAGGGGEAPKADAPKADAPKSDAPKSDAPKGDAPKADAPKGDAPKGDAPKGDAPKGDAPKADAPAEPADPSARVLASPLVRRLAREHDVDLHSVRGSGPKGRIIKRDLDAALEAGPAARSAPAPRHGTGERQPPRVEKLTSMRKTIARRLTESKQTVPHFYLTIDLDVGPLAAARAQINEELQRASDGKEKASINDLLIKAAAIALRRVPEANASFAGDSIHFHQVVDISVAVAIPDGLVTPVVRDADQKGIRAISAEVRELAGRARNKKLTPEEMTNGTFSISNLGMYGIEEFSAVINPPEGCILAVGTLREEPVVKDGAIAIGQRMRVTLSCDHRVVDGALGARWLAAFRELVEHPVLMLI
ncbi:MAG: pyruvate dehydrogenase complex dihydrolipoamide acetyltransferase [Sandaracinaceae bacterium]